MTDIGKTTISDPVIQSADHELRMPGLAATIEEQTMKNSDPKRRNPDPYIEVGEQVSLFRRTDNPIWYAYYRFKGKGVRLSLKTTSLKQAKLLALRIDRDLLTGKSLEPQKAPLIEDGIKEYLEHLIGRFEGIQQGNVRTQYRQKLLVGNGDQ